MKEKERKNEGEKCVIRAARSRVNAKKCALIDDRRTTQESWNGDRQRSKRYTPIVASARVLSSCKFEMRQEKKSMKKRQKKKSNTRPSFEVKFDACSMIKETYYARGCNFCNLISCRFLRTNPVPSPPSSSPFYPPFFFINSYD